jgi:predicted kinase/nicotinamide mononucleotide adenylyltransferase
MGKQRNIQMNNNFKTFMALMEEETKHVAVLFGRMNPPTKGHEENVKGLKDLAVKHNADHVVIASRSHDPKKNPLSPEDKEKHLKRAFPGTNIKVATKEQPTILHHAAALHKQGYTHLHVAGGGDRSDEYKRLLNQYNGVEGKHGLYNFKKITVHSTGERKAGVSGTDMRNHVKNNNYSEFKKNLPTHIQSNEKHSRELFHDVRKGMGIHENTDRGMFKALFLVGGPGSGKDVIIHEAVSEKNAVEINANKAFDFLMDKKKLSEDTRDYQFNAIKNRTALIINGASDDRVKISSIKEELDELGYTSMMVFVNTSNEVSQNRNNQHSRVISEQVRNEKWQRSQDNIDVFYDMFEYFLEFDNSINLQGSDILIKESKQNEISDICNEISYFFKTKSVNENAKGWLRSHGKLNINEDIQSLFDKEDINENYSKLVKQHDGKDYTSIKQTTNGKGYSKLLQKRNLIAKHMPSKVLNDGNAYGDQARRKSGKIDDVRDGDIQRNTGYSNLAYEEKEKVLSQQEQSEPTLKINPIPKAKKFNTDKETKSSKGKVGVSLLPGKVQNGTGVGDTFDNRTSGSVYPMSGLANVTYRESFDKFRSKLKSEAIDDPGGSDMSMVGGLGNGVNKEPLQTQQDVVNTRSENKSSKKKLNK